MHRMLLAREYGEEHTGLSAILSDRWSALHATPARELHALFATSISFLSIATPSAALLLCGGLGNNTRDGTPCGAAGIFRLAAPGAKAVPEPLVFATDGVASPGALQCGKWMPGDPGLFVTGAEGGEAVVWDTECFRPALTMRGEEEGGSLEALDMSPVQGGRGELVATARTGLPEVALLDLSSGAFTHRLQGHSGSVTDVAWSPTHPHLLASSGTDGGVRLFDVRRAGNTACLVEFNAYRRLPEAGLAEGSVRRAARGAEKRRKGWDGGAVARERAGLLGLGCAWDAAAAPQERRRRRRAEGRRRVRSSGAAGQAEVRVRFTPDGTTVVSGGRDGYFRVWDVHTGRLIASVAEAEGAGMSSMVFEVAGDSYHLLANGRGGLRAYGVGDGTLYARRRGHAQNMSSLVVHPFYEEAYSASEAQIICWAPAPSHYC